MYNLVIVESPSKATTINSYLGKEFKVLASAGHVRDLPKTTLGIDIDNGFNPKYINIQGKTDLINTLKKEARGAEKVYLATDPDREGEAISWHLATVLGLEEEKIARVTFNEITKNVVLNEMKNPRSIDMNLVYSQQARRVLDRIVGYNLSPYLWKTVKPKLSAGRVQSVATRLIVERDEEIENFKAEEYWVITATLDNQNGGKIETKFYGNEKKIDLTNEKEANEIVSKVDKKNFVAKQVKRTTKTKAPAPPFNTSSLLQEASRRLGFQSKRIMQIAQSLYEGINLGAEFGGTHGIITYMRTDSLRISDVAASAAKEYIVKKYGPEFYPKTKKVYKTADNAQDAHEAIRPSNVELEPNKIKKLLTSEQYKLYKLIWERFVASQMQNAQIDSLNVDFECNSYIFKSSSYAIKFKGYQLVYNDEESEYGELYNVTEGAEYKCQNVLPEQNFTTPPASFNEGTLINVLKDKGIGRPSTYATTITTIIDRGYVVREGKNLKSTDIGKATVKIMKKTFPNIVDYKFTETMETSLDEIAEGNQTYEALIKDFYGDFKEDLDKAMSCIKENKVKIEAKETDIICEKCGKKLVIRESKFGSFAACPDYPKCKYTVSLDKDGKPVPKESAVPEKTDLKCPVCGGEVMIKKSRFGKFYACANYPKCKYTNSITENIGVKCPDCGGELTKAIGKRKMIYYRCENYPKCKFTSSDLPTNDKCPECGKILYVKNKKEVKYCTCGYQENKD